MVNRLLAHWAAAQALDERGAWVEPGRLRTYEDNADQIIDCRAFVSRIDALSQFIAAMDGP